MSFTLIMKLSISFCILSIASEGILVVKEYCYLCYRGRYCEAPLRWYCFSILLRNLRFYWVVLGEVSNDIYLILCFIYVSHPSTHFYFKTINKAKTINYRFEDQATQRLFSKLDLQSVLTSKSGIFTTFIFGIFLNSFTNSLFDILVIRAFY